MKAISLNELDVSRIGLGAEVEPGDRSMYDDFLAGVEQASREFDLSRPPLAAIGVDILFKERILVERRSPPSSINGIFPHRTRTVPE
jgi:hypothetical protein